MSAEDKLPPEVEASYSAIIDGILAASDLTTITAKAIRRGLQQNVDYDISSQKKAITDLIMMRFDKYSAEQAATNTSAPDDDIKRSSSSPPEPAPTAKPKATNGTTHSNGTTTKNKKRSASPSDDSESQLSSLATPPPKKKHKKSRSVELSDAALAARLQAEENGRMGRATRGAASGGKRKTPLKKGKGERKKKKSKARVGSDDDSSAENGGEKKEVKRTGGFHKPMALSAPLTALLGETQLSRPQTVKKIWEYIKARDLQDPSDKRQILCDDAMRSVFKSDKVHMFTMNKILNQNLYAVDEVIGGGE